MMRLQIGQFILQHLNALDDNCIGLQETKTFNVKEELVGFARRVKWRAMAPRADRLPSLSIHSLAIPLNSFSKIDVQFIPSRVYLVWGT